MQKFYLVVEKMQHRQCSVGKYRRMTVDSRFGHGRDWRTTEEDN